VNTNDTRQTSIVHIDLLLVVDSRLRGNDGLWEGPPGVPAARTRSHLDGLGMNC
jgi:hypothetical protein